MWMWINIYESGEAIGNRPGVKEEPQRARDCGFQSSNCRIVVKLPVSPPPPMTLSLSSSSSCGYVFRPGFDGLVPVEVDSVKLAVFWVSNPS